jgi:CheY-specific phosphatase CheX
MNSNERMDLVRKVMARVLEDASFVFADDLPPAAREGVSPENIMGVSLAFSGERTGEFRLWANSSFAALLTANMTGIDADSPIVREKGADAMKEIMNIIAGNALTELFGTAAVFDLGIPHQADRALFEADRTSSSGVWLLAEEHPVLLVTDLHGI